MYLSITLAVRSNNDTIWTGGQLCAPFMTKDIRARSRRLNGFARMGLDAYEYSFGRGVRLKYDTAKIDRTGGGQRRGSAERARAVLYQPGHTGAGKRGGQPAVYPRIGRGGLVDGGGTAW